MLSCGWAKTELFENADVTASRTENLGIMQGHYDCLFSFIEVRPSKFESSRVLVWTGIFSKTSCGRGYFFKGIKKMRFQKYPNTFAEVSLNLR